MGSLSDRLQFLHLAELSNARLLIPGGVADPFAVDCMAMENGVYSSTMGAYISLLGNDADCKLFLQCNGTNGSTTFTDDNQGGAAKTFTAHGGAQISTAASVFGGASYAGSGASDYVDTPAHSDLDLGSGDFTIQGWFKVSAGNGHRRFMFGQQDASNADRSYRAEINASNLLQFIVRGASGAYYFVNGSYSFVSDRDWHHLAAVRNGNTLTIYMDGAVVGSVAMSEGAASSSSKLAFGRSGETDSNYWYGNLDHFSIHRAALWTSSFQPFAIGTPGMVLTSDGYDLPSVPTEAAVSVLAGPGTLVTDVAADVSRDGGTSWQAANLALVHELEDGRLLFEDDAVDLTGIGSGAELKYRTKTSEAITKSVSIDGALVEAA